MLSMAAAACRNSAAPELEYSGTVEIREVQTGSKVGGRVTEVLVREGQLVRAGAVLVRFDAGELDATRRQLEARVLQAEAELARLQNGYRREEIDQAEAVARQHKARLDALKEGPRTQEIEQAAADLAAAQAEADNAQRNHDRVEQLFKTGDVSAQLKDDAVARRNAAVSRRESIAQRLKMLREGTREEDVRAGEAQFQQASAQAKLLRSGFRPEEVRLAQGRLREARALLDEANVRLAEAEIRAPASCGEGCSVEVVSVRPGDVVAPNRPLATLLEPGQLWVRIYVPEPDLGRVSIGQKARIKLDSLDGREFDGIVEQISSRSEFLPRNVQTREDRNRQVFGVKVRVDNSAGVMKSGMAASVKVEPRSGGAKG